MTTQNGRIGKKSLEHGVYLLDEGTTKSLPDYVVKFKIEPP
jgi:hypothetical protein